MHACLSLTVLHSWPVSRLSYLELIVIFQSSYCVILSSCPFFGLHGLNADAEGMFPKGSYLTILNKFAPIVGWFTYVWIMLRITLPIIE